jgi:uncharacterized membrane protein YhaH (DUF805 family)
MLFCCADDASRRTRFRGVSPGLGEVAVQDYIENFKRVLNKYAVFTGVASRGEFWKFFLVNIIIIVIAEIPIFIFKHSFISWIFVLALVAYGLATLVPHYAVMVRRLHDTGRSGWWILICFVPFVGWIILWVLLALQSAVGPNKYNTGAGAIPVNVF